MSNERITELNMTNEHAIEVLVRLWHDWKLNNKLYNMPDTEQLPAIQLGIAALKTIVDMEKGGQYGNGS